MASPELKVRVLADTKRFTSQMKSVQSRVKEVGKGVARAGKMISAVATTSITAFGATSLKAFDEQAKAEGRLRAALIANGREVNSLFSDYAEFASALQQITTVGDESTLQMIQVSESMGLSGEQAKRSVKNAIALSKAFGMNEQSAIRYTAALEQGDATMLRRYIPALRQIEDESQMVATAQELLGNMFSAATSEAEAGLGPIQQMRNAFGDLQEDLGEVVAKALIPVADRLKEFFELMQKESPEAKKNFVLIATGIAALGPVLVVLGSLAASISAINTALVTMKALMLGNPFTLVATAIAAMSVVAISAARDLKAFRNEIKETLSTPLQQQSMEDLNTLIAEQSERLDELRNNFRGTTKESVEAHRGQIAAQEKILEQLIERRDALARDQLAEHMRESADNASDLNDELAKFPGKPIVLIEPIDESTVDTLDAFLKRMNILQSVGPPSEQGFADFLNIDWKATFGEPLRVELSKAQQNFVQFAESINNLIRPAIDALVDSFVQLFEGDISAESFLKGIINMFANFAIQLGKTAIAIGIAASAVKKAIQSLQGGVAIAAGIALVAAGTAFKGMAAKMAEGGIVPSGFPNDTYPALLTSGEMVVPKPHALPNVTGGAVEVFGEFRVRGSDLVTAISNTNNRTLR